MCVGCSFLINFQIILKIEWFREKVATSGSGLREKLESTERNRSAGKQNQSSAMLQR